MGRCLNSSLLTVVIIIVLLHIFHGKSPQKTRQPAPQPPSSDNGTYQDDTDREAIQLEVDALKSEIDRISTATEYNGMALLDGSLGGTSSNVGSYGAKFGHQLAGAGVMTSNVVGMKLTVNMGTATKGGANAAWAEDGTELVINLADGETYTQSQINDIIANADQGKAATLSPASVTWELENGLFKSDSNVNGGKYEFTSVAGLRGVSAVGDLGDLQGAAPDATLNYSDNIKFTRNSYGTNDSTDKITKITVATDAAAGKEMIDTADDGATLQIHLSTGVDYTEGDIEKIIKEAGYDYQVDLTCAANPNGDANGITRFNQMKAAADGISVDVTDGAGVGKEAVQGMGKGLTFQIGANGVEDQRVTLNVDDMSSSALGVANADVSTQAAANKAIEMIDKAVKTVSMQRAGLGAMQNRLEYTVNNLTTTGENLTNAESQIRDTDMATEMINYTKFNILQQASQAMLAQANQQPQAVLQLLG